MQGDPEGDLAVDVPLVGRRNNLVHHRLDVLHRLLHFWCILDLDCVGDHGGFVSSSLLEKIGKLCPVGVRTHLSQGW